MSTATLGGSATEFNCGSASKLSDALSNNCANINLNGQNEEFRKLNYYASKLTSLEVTGSTIGTSPHLATHFRYLYLKSNRQAITIKLTDVKINMDFLVGASGGLVTNPMKAVIKGGGGEKSGVLFPAGNSRIEVTDNKANLMRWWSDRVTLANATFGNAEIESCEVEIFNPTIDLSWVDDPSVAGIDLIPCRHRTFHRNIILGLTQKNNAAGHPITIRFDPAYLDIADTYRMYELYLFNIDKSVPLRITGKINGSSTYLRLVLGYCASKGPTFEHVFERSDFEEQLKTIGFKKVIWYLRGRMDALACQYSDVSKRYSVSQASQGDQSEAPPPIGSEETSTELFEDEMDEFDSLMLGNGDVEDMSGVAPGNKESGLSTTAIVVIVVGAVVLVGGIIAGVLLRRGGATEKQKAPAPAAPAAARQPPAAHVDAV